nr:hypothetical protein [Variovorax sp. E3]
MTRPKSARSLSAVPSTLRIPLAARASGDAMFPQVAVRDAYAAGILEQIRDDGSALPEDRATIYGILSRTRRFRSLAQDFLKAHPAPAWSTWAAGSATTSSGWTTTSRA